MHSPATFTGIEPLEARIAPATFSVTNGNDSGLGSLKQAILNANALPGPDTIFIGGGAIKLSTYLPAITDRVEIIGTSNAEIDGSAIVGSVDANNGFGFMLLGPGSSHSILRNLTIYGFELGGIAMVDSSDNHIYANFIGTSPKINVTSRMVHGILVDGGTGNVIGGIYANRIGGNDFGIRVTGGAVGTIIDGNTIGATNLGDQYVAITRANNTGILIEDAKETAIGKSRQLKNTIGHNNTFGIKLASGASSTTIVNNTIGVLDFSVAYYQEWGIFVDGARSTVIGAFNQSTFSNSITNQGAGGIWFKPASDDPGSIIEGNHIASNKGPGIYITRETSATTAVPALSIVSNNIQGNTGAGIEFRCFGQRFDARIESNQLGGSRGTNGGSGNGAGIVVDRTDGVVIGGTGTLGNSIVASSGEGILVKNSTDVSVVGNHIGEVWDGKRWVELGNAGHGIHLVSSGRIEIGRHNDSLVPNTIVSSGEDGIFVDGDAPNPRNLIPDIAIIGNEIGVEATPAKANKGAGIRINDVTRGTISIGDGLNFPPTEESRGGGNLISGNLDGGILIERSSEIAINSNAVSGLGPALFLGDATGVHVVNNEFRSAANHAVVLDHGTTGITFGTVEAGNLVVSNEETALAILDGHGNSIVGNDFRGAKSGMTIFSGENNLVSRNHFTVRENKSFLDLGGDGVTPNDPLDADSGPNTLQNSPFLVSAAIRGGQTLLRGEYRGAANSDVRIEWYVNGEFLAERDVHTDENGVASLSLDLDHAIHAGATVSASATSDANTSEFSPGVIATTPPEVIAQGTASGQKPRVQLRDALTGEVVLDQLAFGKGFRGGVKVAAADVDGDGFTDLIATPRTGNGIVKVFSGFDGSEIARFQAGPMNDPALRSITAGDLDGDGSIEVVIGRAYAMGGRILVHDALSGEFESRFIPFGFDMPERMKIKLNDIDGDNLPELVIDAEEFGNWKRVVLDPVSGQIERMARIVKV
jgi:hypothetical protein